MLEIINDFLSSAILTISVYVFGLLILKKEDSTSNRFIHNLITILVSIILHTFIFAYLEGTIKTILLCLLFALTFKLLFNTTYTKSLLASIVYIIILIIPDLLTIGIATQLLNISKEYYYLNIAGSVFGNILVSMIMIIISVLLRKPLRKIFSYSVSTSKQIIAMSVLTICCIIYFFYKFANGYELDQNIMVYLFAIFVFIIILFTLFKQKLENESISKKYDDLLNVMKTYESDIEEQRIMIHETRNELMTIKCKINDKEKESAIINYIDSILGDKVSSKMSKYSKFKYLPSNGIKGFFYYKFIEAEEKDIKVSVNISKKIENSFLGDLSTKKFKDLVRMIGVYLDNAIDASANSKEKKLGIEIYLLKDDIEIIISNTFDNIINREKIGIEKFTTKGKNHGHGLLLVRHILNNNSIFESHNEIINNLYVQKLKIKNSVN